MDCVKGTLIEHHNGYVMCKLCDSCIYKILHYTIIDDTANRLVQCHYAEYHSDSKYIKLGANQTPQFLYYPSSVFSEFNVIRNYPQLLLIKPNYSNPKQIINDAMWKIVHDEMPFGGSEQLFTESIKLLEFACMNCDASYDSGFPDLIIVALHAKKCMFLLRSIK